MPKRTNRRIGADKRQEPMGGMLQAESHRLAGDSESLRNPFFDHRGRHPSMDSLKERLLFLLRLKEGDEVLFIESDEAEAVVVELKDVLNNRIWFSNKKSVRCNDGCYSYEDVVGSRKYRRIEPILETNHEL